MGKLRKIRFTPTIDTSIYTSGDVLFATIEVKGAVSNFHSAVIRAVTLHDKDDEGVQIDLYFLHANKAMGTINNAPSMADDDADYVTSKVRIATTDYLDMGGVQVATVGSLYCPIQAVEGSQSIYCAGIVTGTPTFAAANNIVIDLWIDDEA